LLLEVDAALRPCRVVHRDFDVWVDPEVRSAAGLETPFQRSQIGADAAHPREQMYSLVYDSFVGMELFDYLLRVLEQFYRVDGRVVQRRVREAFQRHFPEADRIFPAGTTFYFSDETLPG